MRVPSGPSRKLCRIAVSVGPGQMRVEDDALADQLARQRLGERDDAALAGRIDRLARRADAAGVRRDVHHAAEAARRHAAQHDVVHVERAVEVDGDDLAPELGRGVEEVRGAVPAGVVDETTHRPGGRLESLDRALRPRRSPRCRARAGWRGRPSALISAATVSPVAASRSKMPTAQPSSARRRAIAAPMPLAPPVTMTVRSFNPRIGLPRRYVRITS